MSRYDAIAATPNTANVAWMTRWYSIAPYPMVVGSRLPDQANASIQTITSVAVNTTYGREPGPTAPSAVPGGSR